MPAASRFRIRTGTAFAIGSRSTSPPTTTRRVAIIPMGFCYPGRLPQGGDRSPHPACAPLWRARLLSAMLEVRLILLMGGYSQVNALGPGNVTGRVRAYRDHLPRYFPLPHPSWRTGVWERRSPWFIEDVLPALRSAVHQALSPTPSA